MSIENNVFYIHYLFRYEISSLTVFPKNLPVQNPCSTARSLSRPVLGAGPEGRMVIEGAGRAAAPL